MDFQTFCDDILNMHTALMSEQQLAEARELFNSRTARPAKETKEKHPDAGMKLAQLIAKVTRLLANQKYAVNKAATQGLDSSLAQDFVEKAEQALSVKTKKADLLNLITLSSEASRSLNNQIK